MNQVLRVLCVGAGNMGKSHGRAYDRLDGYEIVGLCTRTAQSREPLLAELSRPVATYSDFSQALDQTQPDVVSISTYTDSHYPYAKSALQQGCHLFVEKPLAETIDQASELIELAKTNHRKMVVGYILRQNPVWQRFIDIARSLGKPLVMRMNLNQQSCGAHWQTHRKLLASSSPLVDCGVHYVDVMRQMTGAKPIRVSAIAARLTDEIAPSSVNYGQLQVTFDDGSVGWYEAGWGPMMSETAFFVKDVIGPRGSVSIRALDQGVAGQSADIDSHTQSENLIVHHAQRNPDGSFARPDEVFDVTDQPDHDELCRREQVFLRQAIHDDLDLNDHWDEIIDSMKIVLAADQSFATGQTVELH